MKELPDLKNLSNEEKDALIAGLWEELVKLRELFQEQQQGQKKPKKTSKNSSLPPTQGFKANVEASVQQSKPRAERVAHGLGGRGLSAEPDQIVVAKATACGQCGAAVGEAEQQLHQVYERLEIPPVRPIVTRVERHGGTCGCCGHRYAAPVPVGLEPGSPFGKSLEVLITYLRYSHALGYERMTQLMNEVFGVQISEGAIANLLSRVREKLENPVGQILQRLQQSRLVCSDETTARVAGKTQWEWVFQNEQVCLHVIRASRGAQVIAEIFPQQRPQVWVSDLYSAQRTHGAPQWQVCLAHQLRDCQYALEAGDDLFAPRMKRLFLRAIALQRRRQTLTASTVQQYCSRLRGALREILNLNPKQRDGRRLLKRYQQIQSHLLLFLDDETVPPTNNSSEQALRWSVVFRKVTHGFRSDWGAELFAQVRSVINTGKRRGMSSFEAISSALTSPHPFYWDS
jgi:transposase